MWEKLKSRKLLATFLGAILTTLNSALGIVSDDMMQNILNLIMIYIGGQAVVDTAAAIKS